MKPPAKPTLDQRIAQILIQLQSRWERLNKSQISQWNAYADYRLISDSCTDALNASLPSRPIMKIDLTARQYFITQNFYRLFYGPLNSMGPNPIMLTPIFAPAETMDIWGPKGEWSNKDIIHMPFPINIKTHFAIIWESAPFSEPSERVPSPLLLGGAGGGLSLMRFTTLNGRDQDTTVPYREQFGRIPKSGESILTKAGFANKLTGVVSNLVTSTQKVTAKP